MKGQWSAFRITLLLYFIALILPFSFYFIYTSFKTIQEDTKAVQLVSWTAGVMDGLLHSSTEKPDKDIIVKVDSQLKKISKWINTNDHASYYIGANSLSSDLNKVKLCWKEYNQVLSMDNISEQHQHYFRQCAASAENLSIVIEKMVYLRQNKLINMFYLSIIVAILFTVLLIYLVRRYIHIQLKKHAIHDHDTHLFNQKYFLAELHTTTERSKRENSPLSMVAVTVTNLLDDIYTQKEQKHLVQKIAYILGSLTRESDTLCRYDNNHFIILMEHTDKESAQHLEERIKKALENHDFHTQVKPEFRFNTTQFHQSETEHNFVTRTVEK